MSIPLEQHDPELFDLVEKEKARQWSGIELIASEVRRLASPAPHVASAARFSPTAAACRGGRH
jgi:glycine/serine hydroxymethyltransferase